jgi:hypothetical protein
MVFAAGAKAQNPNSNDNATTGKSHVLAVVGDIACQPGAEPTGEKAGENCVGDTAQNLYASQQATANQIEAMKPDLVALVGDEQYQVGNYSDFENSYDLTYGAFKKITRPAPGNHEFYYEHGAIGVAGYGYFSYFNGVQITTAPSNPYPSGPTVPAGTPVMTTVTGILNTGGSSSALAPPMCCTYTPGVAGTFTQPIPNSDGQAGHFDQSGGDGSAKYENGPNAGATAPVGVGDGWYSYNLGSWHLISLNIECETQPGGCPDSTTSSDPGNWFARELAWLKDDLAANHSQCTAAYWHQPTFSAANTLTSPEGPSAGAFWQLLYQYGADLVLNGHDHLYARYRPLEPVYDATANNGAGGWTGVYDPKKGIREFIVGTGGETLDPVGYGNDSDPTGNASFNTNNLEKATGSFWGVMSLTLNENGYAWDFESALPDTSQTGITASSSYSDKGVGSCHGGPFGDNGQGNN